MSVIRIKTCSDSFEANIMLGKMKQAGIECFLTNENFSTLMPRYTGVMDSGVHIMIDEKDTEVALEILNEPIAEKAEVCPHCKSTNVAFGAGRKWAGKYMLLFLSILFFFPFGMRKPGFYCRDCGREF
ncbi:MAG: hypothetical protein A2W93_09010 [Bacteroidetes bacterium GWF2_43_63]|nr:MAG: hypothetical protein A2W94_02785 [Bacteroidetes bacterium GWE2_42_42]OFY55264.1 MAG: hypothetical protein A2W93_09010 [Bacteroidetes bacterium GWF2_43_63]